MTNNLRLTKILISLITAISLYGCTSIYNPITGKKEYSMFDDKAEVEWGDNMAKQIKTQKKIIYDEALSEPLQKLGEKIAAKSHRNYLQYHFYIVDEDVINAVALPGGHVFVNRGLLEKCDEDQVTFVLAHEIGHINARHGVKVLEANLGFSVLSIALAAAAKNQDAANSAQQIYDLLSKGYSRGDELFADSLALKYTADAGYDPQAAIALFGIFKAEEKKSGANLVPVYLRTHPTPQVRIDNVQQKLKEMKGQAK
jgi:predicted Zn-dependent protease